MSSTPKTLFAPHRTLATSADNARASLVTRMSWVVERHLGRPLTLAGLAAACGVSRFHMTRIFARATQRSLMNHVRARRLSEAAKLLASGHASSILDLALAAGYGSHAAFSRAFRQTFGIAPEDLRRRGTLDGVPLIDPIPGNMARALSTAASIELGGSDADPVAPTEEVSTPAGGSASRPAAPLLPRRESVTEPWVFVGLAQCHAFAALEAIAGQWARFMARVGEIDEIADPIPWGVARPIDADKRFDYLAAVRVPTATGEVPAGLTRRVVAPATYVVFRHAAHVSQIRATYEEIWGTFLPGSGLTPADAPTLEHHCPTFDTRTGEGGVEIWIPVVG